MIGTNDDARSDVELVEAYRGGESTAFDALVTRHLGYIYGRCLRYFNDPTDAEDATQEVLTTLLRRVTSYQAEAQFTTWLHTVATNTCHDLARKRARRPVSVGGETADRALEAAADPSAADEMAARELDGELVAALAQLDGATRTAVVAHDVGGHPYADIAAAQGVAVGTIKSRIHRGHARLAEILAGNPDADTGVQPTT